MFLERKIYLRIMFPERKIFFLIMFHERKILSPSFISRYCMRALCPWHTCQVKFRLFPDISFGAKVVFCLQNKNILQNPSLKLVYLKKKQYLCSRKGVASNFFAWQSHAWVSV